MKKIHPIYFSSKKHFKYLLMSVQSLLRLKSELIGNIYIYIDEDDYLDIEQINTIKSLRDCIIIRKTKYIIGYGKDYIMSEISAFEQVSKEIDTEDYIAKTDSDVIFIKDKIFEQVIYSNKILIGFEENSIRPSFVQGGLYFIKSYFIKEIINFDQSVFKEVADNFFHKLDNKLITVSDKYPEDAVIYSIIKKKTDQILFISFMMIPKYYNTKNPSIIHFAGTKDAMVFYVYMGILGIRFYLIREQLFRNIGKIGGFIKNKSPFLYKILKPFFPDRG